MVRQLAIPLRLGVAGGLFPRCKDGSALQITDGRMLILTVEREPRDATCQARSHEKKENQAHEWLRGLHEPRLLACLAYRAVCVVPVSDLPHGLCSLFAFPAEQVIFLAYCQC